MRGISGVCFLKELQRGEKPRAVARPGVVSGLICRKTLSTTAPARAPAPKPGTPAPKPGTPAPKPKPSRAPTTLKPTTTTTITTPLPASVKTGPGTLFCFALMLPFGYEPQLLAMQFRRGSSLFACDEHAVYSNRSYQVAKGLDARVVNISLKCRVGGEFKTALNTPIFRAIWSRVLSDGEFKRHAWTVKVDPDCVFFPSRLKFLLKRHAGPEGPHGKYLNNCKFGMHGPLEVLSRKAVWTLVRGWEACAKHFQHLCKGPCWWGEDMFADQCLSKVLGAHRQPEFELLSEDHCAPPADWATCSDTTKAAFHPFKALAHYEKCLDNADYYYTLLAHEMGLPAKAAEGDVLHAAMKKERTQYFK